MNINPTEFLNQDQKDELGKMAFDKIKETIESIDVKEHASRSAFQKQVREMIKR